MSGFLYFLPGTMSPRRFDELGLTARVRPARSVVTVGPELGPDGLTGLIMHDEETSRLPQPLEWFDQGDYWLGFHRGYPPAPERLDREEMLGSHAVLLLDENEWRVPMVWPCRDRDPDRMQELPNVYQGIRLEAQEEPTGIREEVQPAYRYVIDAARKIAPYVLEDDAPELPSREAVPFCAVLLGVNYRIGLPEVLALGLLGARQVLNMLRIAFDIDEFAQARFTAEESAVVGNLSYFDLELATENTENAEDPEPEETTPSVDSVDSVAGD